MVCKLRERKKKAPMPQTAGYWENRTAFPLSRTGNDAHGCIHPFSRNMFRAKEKALERERECTAPEAERSPIRSSEVKLGYQTPAGVPPFGCNAICR